MEEIEVSTEHAQETIHHHAQHSNEGWLLHCALLSAFLAVAAAVAGLYSAHFANEAMIEQMQATDKWSYYQAKGIKAMLTEMRGDILESEGKKTPNTLVQKLATYRKEQEEIKTEAAEKAEESAHFLHQHEILAKSTTAFQISIAITAMAAISRRKHFLLLTLALSIAGAYFMAIAFGA